MLIAETIVKAAGRWIALLRTSTYPQAWSLIQANVIYTDLTRTQYAAALDWLAANGFVLATDSGFELVADYRRMSARRADQSLFERILETSDLPWLPDADQLVPDHDALPQDAVKVCGILGIDEEAAFLAVRRVHGRIDLEKRARIGAAGEKELFALLEKVWPNATIHVAEKNDGFGYDLAFLHQGTEWHLEVKSSVRRGRLAIHLSRHEFEVGSLDPNWRLIHVGLNQNLEINSLSTVRFKNLSERAPTDVAIDGRWQSAVFSLASDDLAESLDFIDDLSRDYLIELIVG